MVIAVIIGIIIAGVVIIDHSNKTGNDRFLSLGITCLILSCVSLLVYVGGMAIERAWLIGCALGAIIIAIGCLIFWACNKYYLPNWVEGFGVVISTIGFIIICAALNHGLPH